MEAYLRHCKERPKQAQSSVPSTFTLYQVNVSFLANMCCAVVVDPFPHCSLFETISDTSFHWALYGTIYGTTNMALYGSTGGLASYGSRHDIAQVAHKLLGSRLESAHTCNNLTFPLWSWIFWLFHHICLCDNICANTHQDCSSEPRWKITPL